MHRALDRAIEGLRPAILLMSGCALLGLVARGAGGALYGPDAAGLPGSLVFVSVFVACGGAMNLRYNLRYAERGQSPRVTGLLFAIAALVFVSAVAAAALSPLAWAWPLALSFGLPLTATGIKLWLRKSKPDPSLTRGSAPSFDEGPQSITREHGPLEPSFDERLKLMAGERAVWRREPIVPPDQGGDITKN